MTAFASVPVLLSRVYRHYPRGIDADDARHRVSEETRRLACVHEAAALACGKQFVPVPDEERVAIDPEVQDVVDALRAWTRFGERCRQAFPDCIVWDESGPFFEPGYRYAVTEPGWTPPPNVHPDDADRVVCVVSVLAPVFAIYTYVNGPDGFTQPFYGDFPDRYRDRIDTLCTLTADTFGFSRLERETLLQPVPDVEPFCSNRPMSETKLMDCLFLTYP